MCQKRGVFYHYKCSHMECPEQYIGESVRTFGDRFREHPRAPSPIHLHRPQEQVDMEYFTITDRKAWGATRTIKEAIYIRVNDCSLNINLGKYNLVHLWEEVLKDTLHYNSGYTLAPSFPPTMGTSLPPLISHTDMGGTTNSSLASMVPSPLIRGATLSPSSPLLHLIHSFTPLTQNYTQSGASLVSRHFII